MTRWLALMGLLLLANASFAQPKPEVIPPRFEVVADIERFPQTTPKETLRSVLKAIDAKKVDYVLAHLSEPAFMDKRVKDLGGKFDAAVKETSQKLEADPEVLRELRKFLADGEWPDATGETFEVKCKEVRAKQLFLKKVGKRWYLENRTAATKEK